MSPPTLPPNTRTSRVSQQISSLRELIRIPVKRSRNDHTKMNGDDSCKNVTIGGFFQSYSFFDNVHAQLAEFGQSHPYGKTFVSQGTKHYMSQPVLGLEVGDVDNVAGRHSIDYLAPPKHEDGNGSPRPARRNPPLKALPPIRTPGKSQVLAPLDATRLRHVPRGPVARVHPTMPPSVIDKSRTHSDQKTLAHSKSISDALLSGTQASLAILGIDVGAGGDNSKSKLDNTCGVVGVSVETKCIGAAPLSHDPGRNTSPAISNTIAKQERPILPSLHHNNPQIRPLASPPRRDINKPSFCGGGVKPCSSTVSTGSLELEVLATEGHSKEGQHSVRPIVRPLPALPGGSLNGSGSASTGTKRLVGKSSPPPSDPTESTESCSVDENDRMVSRSATTLPPARFGTHTSQLRIPPVRRMSNNKDQSEDDTPTPTFPFSTPRRSKTIGVPPLSRNVKPPSLSIPPLDRSLSLRGFTEGSARVSPSVIIRPSPLPIFNLPVLVPSANRVAVAGTEGSEEGSGQLERRRSRLMRSMPALPLQGSSRGTRGHEEVDDLEEEDDDDDDDEGEDDDEVTGGVSGQSSASSQNETPRSSLDSTDGEVVERLLAPSHSCRTLSTTSSYETARAEPSPSFWGSHRWDADQPPPAEAGNKASSSSKVSPHLPQVGITLSGSGIAVDPSTVLDRKPIEELDFDGRGFFGASSDASHGKTKQELGEYEDEVGDIMEDALPSMKDSAGMSNSKGRGDRGVEAWTRDIGAGAGERSRTADGRSGLKVIATPHVKVAQSYESEALVLERRVASGSAGRARLNPSPGDGKSGVSPRHPLPLEPLRAIGSTAVEAKEVILGLPRPGDRAMRLDSTLSSTSTTPLGSPKLDKLPGGIGRHNEMYRRASRSLIDVHGIEMKERVEKMVRDQEEEEERRRSSRVLKVGVSSRNGNEDSMSQDKKKRSEAEELSLSHSEQKSIIPAERTTVVDAVTSRKTANSQESFTHSLRRRRSMPTTDPPSYSTLFAGLPPGLRQDLKLQPREDEGKEKLPPYTNDIFIKAVLSMKMEFSSPGIQAKDRKWRRVLCVLHGTAMKVYRCPARSAGVSAIGEWWENKIGVSDPLTDKVPSSRSAGRTSAASGADKQEPGGALAREIELARARKGGEGETTGQPLLQIDNIPVDRSQHLRSHSPLPKLQGQGHQQHQLGVSHAATKSALTLAVQLLKPSTTKHSRSNSEASRVPGPSSSSSQSRGASLNTPHGSTSGRTPTTGRTSNDGLQSHVPATMSTHLAIPGSPGDAPDENDLIRVYTMQHAESGLGKDYTKRQHVIRVRLEGEQFLLQTKNVESVIAWIEGLQCAANVALDLDERPMPTGPLIPRRRRRRRAAPAAVASSNS